MHLFPQEAPSRTGNAQVERRHGSPKSGKENHPDPQPKYKPEIRPSLQPMPKAIARRSYQLLSGYAITAPFLKKSGDGSSQTGAGSAMGGIRAGDTSSRNARGGKKKSVGCGRRWERLGLEEAWAAGEIWTGRARPWVHSMSTQPGQGQATRPPES